MKKLERNLLNAIIKRTEFLGSGNYLFSNNSNQSIGWTVASYGANSRGYGESVGFFYERVNHPEEIEMCIEQGNSEEIIKYFKKKLGKIKLNLVDELEKVPIGEFVSKNRKLEHPH